MLTTMNIQKMQEEHTLYLSTYPKDNCQFGTVTWRLKNQSASF